MTRNAIIFVLSFLLITLNSCNGLKDPSTSIQKIIIKVFPTFHNNALIVCDLNSRDILFDKLDNLYFIQEDDNMNLEPFYHKFSNEEIRYLNDSIVSLMKELDFKDSEAPMVDGVSTEILFVFQNGTIKKAKLSNSKTHYQGKLIDFMINSLIENCSTNDNIIYAKELKNYYN